MKHVSVVLALVAMIPSLAAAQQPTNFPPLTMSAAIDLALANHPGLRAARAGATAATEEVGVAKTTYLPKLDLLWQANFATRNNVFGLLLPQFVVPPVSGPVLGDDSLGGVWSSAGGVLLSWEAVDFGRRGATVDLARAEAAAADAERRLTDLEIASAAADAYLRVLATDALLAAARANVRRLEAFSSTVRALVQSQLRAGADLSRADAELAAALNREAEGERDVELARLTLAEAIGAPGAAVAVVPTPVLTASGGATATAPMGSVTHPSLAASQARIEAARARDVALERTYRPRVELQTALSGRSVSEHIDGTTAGSGFDLNVPNWAVGVTVSFQSLDVFRIQARRKVEAARQQEAAAGLERTAQALQSDAARARAVTVAADRIAANAPRQLQAAREATTQASARYDAGLGTVVEVADAGRLLADAEAQAAVAALAAWRARLGEAVVAGDVMAFVRQIEKASAP